MAIIRADQMKGYTIMSNYHLHDKNISLKAKGLLSQMLSLSENWDYTMPSKINKESIDDIHTAIHELEAAGYIVRNIHDQLKEAEYFIYEIPHTKSYDPEPIDSIVPVDTIESELTEPIEFELVEAEFCEHESCEIESIYQASANGNKDVMDAISAYREIVKDNISYDALCSQYGTEKVSEILELIIDTLCNGRRTIRIGGVNMSSELVKAQFLKLNMNHIVYVLNCMEKNTTEIRNIKSYLLTTLYNSFITMNSYYSAAVNHDLASN